MHTYRRSWRALALGLGLVLMCSMASTALADTQVWVNTNSGVYHCPGSPYYGATRHGKYAGERNAAGHGYRAAYGKPCSPPVAQQARASAQATLASNDAGNSIVVWVNTSSNVYHCPGTQYFGATRHGEYMSEANAIAAGNRAAGGRRC